MPSSDSELLEECSLDSLSASSVLEPAPKRHRVQREPRAQGATFVAAVVGDPATPLQPKKAKLLEARAEEVGVHGAAAVLANKCLLGVVALHWSLVAAAGGHAEEPWDVALQAGDTRRNRGVLARVNYVIDDSVACAAPRPLGHGGNASLREVQ